MRGRTLACAAALGAIGCVPGLAHAGNGIHPRTPVWFQEGCCTTPPVSLECISVVDRSVDPSFQFAYDIPFVDVCLCDEEVPNSRTHQFFAFGEQLDPRLTLPVWIDAQDMLLTIKHGIPTLNPTADDVLETSTQWQGQWHAVTTAAERRPITCEAVAGGVDWDTTAVPAGSYVIYGYTWEPPFNLWSVRQSVVKLVDTADPAASAPSLSITSPEVIVAADDVATLEGCVDAMAGSTITGYWGPSSSGTSEWNPFVTDQPVSTGPLSVEFDPPTATVGTSVVIRIDIEDPMGRTYTAYMPNMVVVLGAGGTRPRASGSGTAHHGCEDMNCEGACVMGTGTDGTASDGGTGDSSTSGTTGGGSGSTGSTSTGGTSTGTTAETTAADEGGDDGGGECGCRHDVPAQASWWLAPFALLLRRRRP